MCDEANAVCAATCTRRTLSIQCPVPEELQGSKEKESKGAQPPWIVWHRTSGICHTREQHKRARANGTRWGDISFAGAGITAPSRRLCAETGCATKQTQCAPQHAHVVHNPSNALVGGVAGAMGLHRRNRKSSVCGIHVSQKSSAKQTHGEKRRSLAAGD